MKTLIASALLLTPLATPAAAQGGPLDNVPAVRAVKNQLRQLCRTALRPRANFVADFLFSVDATGSGTDRDIYLTGPASNARRAVLIRRWCRPIRRRAASG